MHGDDALPLLNSVEGRAWLRHRDLVLETTWDQWKAKLPVIAHVLQSIGSLGWYRYVAPSETEAFNVWAGKQGLALDIIEPGKPQQSAFVESFNGIFRNECLNTHWFNSLDHARDVIEE